MPMSNILAVRSLRPVNHRRPYAPSQGNAHLLFLRLDTP